MTPVESKAFPGTIIVPIKMAMMLKGEGFWFNTVTSRHCGNAIVTRILSFVVVIVTLVCLLQKMPIVQIWAATVFSVALISLVLAPFSRFILVAEEQWFTETDVLKTGWIPAVVWILLIVWVLCALQAGSRTS